MQEFSNPALIDQLFQTLQKKEWKLTTAESCTGGMIAATITDKAGSSSIFECGFVTYSNEAKINNLNVSAETLEKHGAVSEQTAVEMAIGALKNSHADIAISVTGIAGPDGGSAEKPVGLVYIGSALKKGNAQAIKWNFTGSRAEIRLQSLEKSIEHILNIIK